MGGKLPAPVCHRPPRICRKAPQSRIRTATFPPSTPARPFEGVGADRESDPGGAEHMRRRLPTMLAALAATAGLTIGTVATAQVAGAAESGAVGVKTVSYGAY